MLINPQHFTRRAFVRRSSQLLGATAFSLPLLPAETQAATGKPVDLKKIILAQYEAYAALDLDRLEEFYTEDVVFDDQTWNIHLKNREEMRKMMADIRPQYVTLKFELTNLIVSGNWAVAEHIQTATMRSTKTPNAELKKYSVRGISVMGFAGNRIKRQTDYYDVLGYRKQMGQTPAGQ